MHIKRRKKRIAWTALILLLGMGSAAFALIGRHQSPEMGKRGTSSNEDQAINVKTIRPKRDVKFQVTSHHVAAVEPYYQADLRARASGQGALCRPHGSRSDSLEREDLGLPRDPTDREAR